MADLVKLKEMHKIVARELAKGRVLKDICTALELKVTSWYSIVNAPLFQEEVSRLSRKLEEESLDEVRDNPVIARLEEESLTSVEMLAKERDNFNEEQGATSGSRIKAANSILDRAQYGSKRDEPLTSAVVINLSQAMLDRVSKERTAVPQPDNFTEANIT